MSVFFSILTAVILLGILVTLHELGHYISGRLLGLPVIEFAVGFGPKLFGWERKGIAYSIRVLPLGGFCAFAGDDEGAEGPGSLNDRPAWRRLVMQLSGPAMNLIAGYVFAVILLSAIGLPFITNAVQSVEEGRPAAQAGLLSGDTIVEVNGQAVSTNAEISTLIREGQAAQVLLTVEREGSRRELAMTPFYDEAAQVYRVGFTFAQDFMKMPLGESIMNSGRACVDMVKQMFGILRDIVFGRQSTDDLVGVVGAVTMISSETRSGFEAGFSSGMFSILNLAILISINLGLMNLLPLPALDGGRIVFSLIEIIARRPVPRKAEAIVHTVGMVLLFTLMGVLVFKDVWGLITGKLLV